MSAIVKQERHEQETTIFATRHEAGVRAMRDWLLARQAEVNALWLKESGDALMRLQGEAVLIAKQIKMIEHGPAVKLDQTRPTVAST